MSKDTENQEEVMLSEQTEDLTNKKCPNCGATVKYDPALRQMHCEYCGYTLELPKAEEENTVVELDFAAAAHKESFEWGVQKKSVECKQCGAVTIYDALETAAVCPFCGSTNVMPAATQDSIAPGGVCPFTVTKEQAAMAYMKRLNKKWFAPRKAKRSALPKAIKGVYLPYWTFDAQTTSNFSARAGYDRTVKKKDGSSETVTDWRPVSGVFQEFIDDETLMASKREENSVAKECEPYDLSRVVPYTPQAVAGFAAERYSIGLKEGWKVAQEDIHHKLHTRISSFIRSRWHCNRVSNLRFSTIYTHITYKYILVPAWISSFKYKDKVYQFAVNGQTGKVGGKTPVSAWRVILAILLGIGVCVGLYYLMK